MVCVFIALLHLRARTYHLEDRFCFVLHACLVTRFFPACVGARFLEKTKAATLWFWHGVDETWRDRRQAA